MNKWVCDVRIGSVAVYRGPEVNCFSDLHRPAYHGSGKKIWHKDGGFHWTVPARKVRWARFVCWLCNTLDRLHLLRPVSCDVDAAAEA